MVSFVDVLLFCGLNFVIAFIYGLWTYILHPIYFSSVWNIPGPYATTFWGSHFPLLTSGEKSASTNEFFVKRYGRTFRLQGAARFDQRIITLDPLALSHILNRSSIYQKPWQSRSVITSLIGEGLFSSEGLRHKKQRRVSQPAFSPQNLKMLLPTFYNKASQLADKLACIVGDPSKQDGDNKNMVVDINLWITRTTLDIIGLCGFGIDFNAIHDETNEVYLAYKDLCENILNKGQNIREIIVVYFPFMKYFLPSHRSRLIGRAHEVIYRVGHSLIKEKQGSLRNCEKGRGKRTDLLTLLLKSNTSTDIQECQRIDHQDILYLINTFLFAGSDTTSLALTWTINALANNPDVQTQLREELTTYAQQLEQCENTSESSDIDTYAKQWSDLDSLPYLDAVVKESLRLLPPLHSSVRIATDDDVIPLSEDMKLADGTITRKVVVKKGQWVHVPFEGLNVDREVWGEDAWEFKPERWFSIKEAVKTRPGIYSNLTSFSAGPRSCIGYRFAIMEMKTILHALITRFTFAPDSKIIRTNVILTRPYVEGDYAKGRRSSCPLRMASFSA